MHTILIYDIPEDRLRDRIAEVCKDYGLARIQWSAFMGNLNHNRREELEQRLRRTLGPKDGNIQLYPICDKDLHLMSEIGRADLARGRGVSPELDIGLRATPVEEKTDGVSEGRSGKSGRHLSGKPVSAGKPCNVSAGNPRQRSRKGGSGKQ